MAGAVLMSLQEFGSRPQDLHGIDLLVDRIEVARQSHPEIHFQTAENAEQLCFERDLMCGRLYRSKPATGYSRRPMPAPFRPPRLPRPRPGTMRLRRSSGPSRPRDPQRAAAAIPLAAPARAVARPGANRRRPGFRTADADRLHRALQGHRRGRAKPDAAAARPRPAGAPHRSVPALGNASHPLAAIEIDQRQRQRAAARRFDALPAEPGQRRPLSRRCAARGLAGRRQAGC